MIILNDFLDILLSELDLLVYNHFDNLDKKNWDSLNIIILNFFLFHHIL